MPHSSESSDPIEIFYAYSHKDEKLRDSLEIHLNILSKESLIIHWCDRQIRAGKDWKQEIASHLNTAQIILLLISPDFLASEFCYSTEMQGALERQQCGDALVIPIILRPTHWEDTPIRTLKALPRDAKPITTWHNRDEAFYEVAEDIQNAISERFNAPFTKNSHNDYISSSYKHLKKVHEATIQFKLSTLSKEHTLNYTFEWHGFWGDRFRLFWDELLVIDTGRQFLGIPRLNKIFEVENIKGSFSYFHSQNDFSVVIKVGERTIFAIEDSWNK
ncbi:MAG: toll/interleukin-1 receptor domain-containing protein [Chloroflexota bacterium]|nr:toll/interleukin-1 receptor domain-containing protein [Chloroflexota bacterium]